ncbi:MAG: phenylalanine--tRNA ligase subunit beta [Myxococcaceae bacterium]|nr:phenylalanine--tRNA ligase subunit beta [Myxococcaceae bacterium]
MRISLKWLKDYVALPASVDELASRLTMAGLEIEAIDQPARALEGVVVAQIAASDKHPNADKLSVTKIDWGGGAALQVVCGAKNYKVGDKVPLATVGTKLPNGVEIKQAALRGVESAGMLCSSKELGLSDESSGLLILPADAKVGQPIAQALGLDDVIFTVNVTPNRADALSHLGIAREISTLFDVPLTKPTPRLAESSTRASTKIAIRIEDAERCWRYAARVIEGVTVKPSPQWMQDRLKAAGMRGINNLVDITNYVLLEYGQPLHAFDLDRIGGAQIVVRTAKGGETLTTLDGKERQLQADDLLICDKDTPLVLAGVMGGASSEVTEKTTRVLLECACFQPTTVRRSAKRHALHTESSHRFERGTDINVIPEVLDRTAALIVELAGGTVLEGRVDAYPAPKPPRQVTLRTQKVADVLGVTVPGAECHRILTRLGFTKVSGDEQVATFAVPTVRVDVSIEEDLVEEIARVRGFDAIPEALPRGLSELEPERPAMRVERLLRAAMAGQGVDEVVNYSFVSPAELAAFSAGKDAIAVSNPLSVEQSVMRTTLFPSLVQNVLRASRHQTQGVRFYEWARSYRPDESGGQGTVPVAKETLELAGVLWGMRHGTRTWTSKDAEADYFDARAVVESALEALHIDGVTAETFESPWYHPRSATVLRKGQKVLGTLGELHPRVMKKLDAPPGIVLFQLDVEALQSVAVLVPQARPLSKFPAVLRDLAVVVAAEMQSEAVRQVILEVGQPLVEDAQVFDVYAGHQVGTGRKNLAFALRYRSPERTLTDAEVTEAHTKIVAEVTRRLGGALRT